MSPPSKMIVPLVAGSSLVFLAITGVALTLMNGDGGNPQQLTSEPAPASSDNPSWSAAGKRILFDTSRTGRPEIWMMDAGGTNQRPLIRDIRLIPGRTSWQPMAAR